MDRAVEAAPPSPPLRWRTTLGLRWRPIAERISRVDPGLAIVTVAALLAAVWFSKSALERWDNFTSTAYDLAILDQLAWNTAHGDWFHSTFANYMFLGEHMQPVLVLWAAVYKVFDVGPPFLIISQAVGAAFAAPLLYCAVRRFGLSAALSVVVSFAYLLNPYLHRAVNYDFHPEVLLVLFVFGSAWAVAASRYWLAVLLALCVIAFKEDTVCVAIALAALMWWHGGRKPAAITAAIAIVWTVFVIMFLMPYIRHGVPSEIVSRYGYLAGTKDQADFLPEALLHPWRVLEHLLAPSQLWTLFLFAASSAPLAIFRPKLLPFIFPNVAIAVLSTHPPQHLLELQYAVEAVPLAVLFSALGAKYLAERVRWEVVGVAIAVPALAGYIGLSPFSPTAKGVPQVSPEHRAAIMDAVAVIPDGRYISVSAQSTLAPRVAHRKNIWEFPRNALRANWVMLDQKGLVSSDSAPDFASVAKQVEATFDLVYDRDGVEVYRNPNPPAHP
ncbi:MAG: DUF2079 domain-containing protein [Tepidiformaceae bacterium]